MFSYGETSGQKVGLTRHKCWFLLMVQGSFDKFAIRTFPATLSMNEGWGQCVVELWYDVGSSESVLYSSGLVILSGSLTSLYSPGHRVVVCATGARSTCVSRMEWCPFRALVPYRNTQFLSGGSDYNVICLHKWNSSQKGVSRLSTTSPSNVNPCLS